MKIIIIFLCLYLSPLISCDKHAAQKEVANRDLRLAKNPSWKGYFPEILAGTISLLAIFGFCCWWHCTGRTLAESSGNRQRRYYGMRPVFSERKESIVPNVEVVLPKAKPLPRCTKPACLCVPEKGERATAKKGWNKWRNEKENEAYGPAN